MYLYVVPIHSTCIRTKDIIPLYIQVYSYYTAYTYVLYTYILFVYLKYFLPLELKIF